MIEKEHLGAWDFVAHDGRTPKDYTLTIRRVESKVLKTREKPIGTRRIVITFAEAKKRFVCNTTNAETIESFFGGDTEGWIGKKITLGQGDVKNPKGRGTVKGIVVRTRPPSASAPTEELAERPVDETMRAEQNAAFGREDEPARAGREPGED
jgi:hypothetical protein